MAITCPAGAVAAPAVGADAGALAADGELDGEDERSQPDYPHGENDRCVAPLSAREEPDQHQASHLKPGIARMGKKCSQFPAQAATRFETQALGKADIKLKQMFNRHDGGVYR